MSSCTHRLRAQAILGALSVLAVATTASSAFAAAPQAGCFVTTVPQGTSLPANAPALILSDTSQGATATITAELVTGDTRAPFVGPTTDAHGLEVLMFPSASVGAHKISTKIACSIGEEKTTETSITLTAPVPFPKSVGTLTFRPSSPPTGLDLVELEPSPDLRAFYPVTVMKLVVGGDAKTTASRSGDPASPKVTFAAHTGSLCVENGALHREKRTVTISVSADIAGLAESPAPATVDVTVDCGAIRWTSENDYKAGKQDTPSATPASGGTASPETTDGGCAAAPASRASRNAGLLVIGAIATLAGLRRRQRRTA